MFFSLPFRPYVAVVGDIVRSKTLTDRNEVQERMKAILRGVNERYVESIASDFMITLGDEFQGLLKSGDSTLAILREIEEKMAPVPLRFGIGVGEITTEIDRHFPLGADGPAYYNARAAVETLKSREKKINTGDSNILLVSQGDNAGIDLLLNSIFTLCYTIRGKWTDRQREIITAYLQTGCNQLRAADRLGIVQPNVHKALALAGYYAYANALETANKAFAEIRADDDV